MSRLVKVMNLRQIGYNPALQLQKYLANLHFLKNEMNADTILLLQHDPVYTIGIRDKDYSEADEMRLKETGADFFRTNRGGLITFHGPGQLVAYPIINLKHYKAGMRWYVSHIEAAIIDLCSKFGLKAETSPHTGVWIKDNKICAIGIHGSRYVTTHGLALNCCVDLKWYQHIVPCGIQGKGVTSLSQELGRIVTVNEVIPLFLESFSNTFQCSCKQLPESDIQLILHEAIGNKK